MLILLENAVKYFDNYFTVRTDDEKPISFSYDVLNDESSFIDALKKRGKKYLWLYERGSRKFKDMTKQQRADYLGSSSVYLNFKEKQEGNQYSNPPQCYFSLGKDFQDIPCVIRLGDHGNDYKQKEVSPLYKNIMFFISILVDEKERVKSEQNSDKLIVDIELRVSSDNDKELEQINQYWDNWNSKGKHSITFNSLLNITNNIKIVVSEKGKKYTLSSLDELRQKIGSQREAKEEKETNSQQPQYMLRLSKDEMKSAIEQWTDNNDLDDLGSFFHPIKSPKDNNQYCRFNVGEFQYVGNLENGKYYYIKPNKDGGTINWQEMKKVNETINRKTIIQITETQYRNLLEKMKIN